jgi:C6 transcription factor Pro1
METGNRRLEALTRLKAQVKRRAKRRRGITRMRTIANGIDASPDLGTLEPCSDTFQDPLAQEAHRPSAKPSSEPITTPTITPTENEVAYVPVYMDYIFPILFPFYRPYITQGGRIWLLSLAMKNTGFMSSIISISSLVLWLVPAHVGPGQEACASKTWDEIHTQASVALESMQRDLQHLHQRGIGNCLLNSVHLLANMMQQLSFELAITPSENWQAHLDAATDLFEQILEYHGKAGPTRQVSAVLSNLSHPSWPGAADASNTEQGAFHFFSSILLFADIISSTVLDQPAKLLEYHSELRRSDSRQNPNSGLEEITGCQTWVLLAISDISTLSRWKKDQMISGKLLKDELIYRATSLERILNNGLDKLGQYDDTEDSSQHMRPLELLLNQSGSPYSYSYSPSEDRSPLTRTWIYAARTYLLSVKLISSTETSELGISVKQIIQSLRGITSSPWLRWLAWPLCVAGIYASKEQRPAIRETMDLVCGFNAFGTMQAAFDIIERTWQKRDAGEVCLDLSTCLGSLGYKALLV